ncbi:MAG TPA: hypothetical protein VJU80_04340, partial [Solirubrobacteraceae bacterium]|nr:hypothetical protein [Solirubrobacteraceae bacterium]
AGYERAWQRAQLDRCHIVPAGLGGSGEASNLYLMCHECHDAAPDTPNRELFLTWADAQCWFHRRYDEFVRNVRDLRLTDAELEETTSVLRSPYWKSQLLEFVGTHGFRARRHTGIKYPFDESRS